MRPSVNDIRNLGEIQSLYRWNMFFTTMPSGITTPTQEELNIRCVSTTLPKATSNDVLINMRGHTVEGVGKLTYERRITMIFLETIDVKVATFLSNWRRGSWEDVTGKALSKKELEAIIRIELLNNQDEPTWEYVMIGCQLKDLTLSQLMEESDDVSKPEAIIGYDYFKEGLPGTVTGSLV